MGQYTIMGNINFSELAKSAKHTSKFDRMIDVTPSGDGTHDWIMVGSPGLYDTTYECQLCKVLYRESMDDSVSKPETGCEGNL